MHMPEKTKTSPGILRRFASYYRPHWKLFTLDMICALGIAGIDLIFPLANKYALEKLLPDRIYGAFFALIAVLVVAYLLHMVMNYIVAYYGHTMGVLVEADMRKDLFTHLQTLSFRFYDKNRTGQLMSRVLNDLFDVTELAHHGPEDLFISLVTLIGSLTILIRIQWRLAIAVFIIVPLMVLFTVWQRKRMRRASMHVRERTAQINTTLESSISGVRVAKAFANEEYEMDKFTAGNERFKVSKREFYKAMGIFHSGMGFMTSILSVTVLAYGGILIMNGQINIIELITFNLYVSAFLQPVRRLTNFFDQYTSGMSGFARFAELMETPPDIIDAPGSVPLNDVKGNIEFYDVSFSYDQEKTVLHKVNLHIAAGRTLALVGPSGGGKTTLCHLIPRFYEVTAGQICIDGQPITDVTLKSLRANIGIVQQDVFLFAGTINENIRYGRVDATDEEVIAAAKLAEIHDDIMQMPDEYDSVVGERGITLSGGQKQRISIARIFLKNPPILILDEATSALDTQTELRIQHAFDRLAQGRTTLVIAHRLSTIKNADEIVVIGDDGILEQGTHDELMRKAGHYAALYNAQFKA